MGQVVLVAREKTNLVLHVDRRLKNRSDDRAGRQIEFLAGVNADGGESGVFRKLHSSARRRGAAAALYDSLLSCGFQFTDSREMVAGTIDPNARLFPRGVAGRAAAAHELATARPRSAAYAARPVVDAVGGV